MFELPKDIQKMPQSSPNYFRYFPVPPAALAWGIAVSAAGRTRVLSGSPYPVGIHPDDHALNWQRGRVLESLQIVFIAAGRGVLETAFSKPATIETGDAFMLFPGVWHRFRPNPDTGWHESWVELQGPTVDVLLRQEVFAPKRPMLKAEVDVGLQEALERVHARARSARIGVDPELAIRGLAVMAAWKESKFVPAYQTRMKKAVEQGERYLADHISEAVNIADLARSLGVAYSHFRHAFRTHTGYAPWKYVIHLRLTRGKRMLARSDATLDEIASSLGFSSGFHFSSAFKRMFGLSPIHWRTSLAGERKSGIRPPSK